MAKIFMVMGLLIIGILVWYFLIDLSPKSYSDCLKTHTNDYSRNDLRCSFSPRTYAEYKSCEKKDGIINQFKQCLVSYYNPDFVFPQNLGQCAERIGYMDMGHTACDIQISKEGTDDVNIAQNLIDQCIKAGGSGSSTSCWIRFNTEGIFH